MENQSGRRAAPLGHRDGGGQGEARYGAGGRARRGIGMPRRRHSASSTSRALISGAEGGGAGCLGSTMMKELLVSPAGMPMEHLKHTHAPEEKKRSPKGASQPSQR